MTTMNFTTTLPDDGRTVTVEVFGPYETFAGGTRPATVNWSGIGSVSPADAADEADGQPERVTMVRRYVLSVPRTFARTTRHDHNVPSYSTVEVIR